MQKDNKLLKTVLGIFLVLLLLYVLIEKYFPSLAVNCKKADLPEAACECLKTKIAKNTPFMDKVDILISGASSERIVSYISVMDMLDCAVRDLGTNRQKQSRVTDDVVTIVSGVRTLLGDYDDFSNIDNDTIFMAMGVSNKNPYGGTYELSVNPSNSKQFIVRINGLNKIDCEALLTKVWTDSVGYNASQHREGGAIGNCGAEKNNVVSIIYGE